MTYHRIGEIIAQLCRIPHGGGLKVHIRCDDCDMDFGEVHAVDAGTIVRPQGRTLVECLEDIAKNWGNLDCYLRDNDSVTDCPKCSGKGHIMGDMGDVGDGCPDCHGTGWATKED